MFDFLPFTREGRRRAAAGWLARMHGPDADAHRAGFEQWLASAENARAFERVSNSYDAAALLRLSGQPSQPVPERAKPAPRQALAAALALAVLVPGAFIVSRSYRARDAAPLLMVSTSVGEIRSVRLADGSKVILDTDTQIELPSRPAAMEVRLTRGRARFSPAHTLIVKSSVAVVEGKGGSFDVALSDGKLAVASYGGEVKVAEIGPSRSGAAQVRPGEELRLAKGASDTGPIANRLWPQGLLEFDDEPLGAAIERANRYSKQRIRLGDKRLEELRLTGVFRAGDAEAFARAVAQTFDLRLGKDGADLILRAR